MPDVVTDWPILAGNIRTKEPTMVQLAGVFAGNINTVSPSIITAHGLTVGNFFVVSPALAEGCGFYTGNLEILSPSVVKGYGLEGLSVQFASPDLIIDAGGVDVFNLKPIDPSVVVASGISAHVLYRHAPAVINVYGIGPLKGTPRSTA
ncbi:hypothetical protein KFE25_002283 [Diacronema lutheri]|uniref:Uncharacterized protein n=1 Tax=Diacronema lutheri TaxID=2081491 RepID=A0A8J5X4K4_DIALT|nr:hypothetical protein KFE25_002283 [Diacronema lutheri]